MNSSLSTVMANALPALSGASVSYNVEKNVFLTLGYTSNMGNTYYKAIRFSDRIIVCYSIGEGMYYTFLNNITLFCWDGTKAKIIAQKFWGGSNWVRFSESFAFEQSVQMLKDYLMSQSKALGNNVSEQELLTFSRRMIQETTVKQIA